MQILLGDVKYIFAHHVDCNCMQCSMCVQDEGGKDSEPHADEDPWDITIAAKASSVAKNKKSAHNLPPLNSRALVDNSGGHAVVDPTPSPLKALGKSPSLGTSSSGALFIQLQLSSSLDTYHQASHVVPTCIKLLLEFLPLVRSD